ncbi:MAG: HAMP domain-containing histidine kinase [Clostridia bacterium]|nr:HAMP domain-containing histidine kinase [Clostridia bacterium]
MANRKLKQRRIWAGRSLNLLLWFAFSAFALVLVVIFMVVQSLLVGQQYRSQTVDLMRAASRQISAILVESESGVTTELWRQVHAIEEEYDVRAYLLDTSGRSLFSDGTESESFPEIAEALKDRLPGAAEIVISEGNSIAYATDVVIAGKTHFLYVSSSLVRLNALETGLRGLTLSAAYFSVVLAFVASGFVAMLITRPVAQVTEQAKELARGKFDLNLRRDYFCLEIAELSDALDYARREISKTDAMQKELIANVSHDFKTPLTMIKAYASMIREISGEDKQKRDTHVQIIIDETDRLAALVGDVLDLSKIRSGVGAHSPTTFNLSELVYRIAERFHYLKETQGYVIITEIAEDLYAYADRERIEQVVYNLIGNAVNYTGADKITRIRLMSKDNFSRLEVEDTGKGIPKEELATIWDRYYRSKEAHKRPVQGTGLGLSIVKNILLVQNCPFGVQSEEGKGSTFWVEFPSPPDDTQDEMRRHKRH